MALTPAAPAAAQRQTDDDQWRRMRERLVAEWLVPWGIRDSVTLAAMRAVPRHEFVPPDQRALAYEDIPLPIGHGQTISQPFVVALMTEAVRPRAGMRVLEVGTGSGYQAAVLAQAGCRVWTIEIFAALAKEARARLARLGYANVTVRHGDGYAGWPEEAPFDAIVVTAAADHLPRPLVEQLRDGGRMVIPIGPVGDVQTLWLVTKEGEEISMNEVSPVRFVPLTREDE